MDNNLVDSMNETEEPKEEKGFWDKITDRFKGGVDRLEKAGVKDLARDTGKSVEDLTASMNKELPEKEEQLISEEEANKFFKEGTTPEEAKAITKSSVGEEFEGIEKASKELDKEDTPLEKGNPNNVFTSEFTQNIDFENDTIDIMGDKVLSGWESRVAKIEKKHAEDRDKMSRDKLIVGMLLAAQGFANGMAVRGTGRIPVKVDASILKDMEDSLTDARDYKMKKAGLQLSNAKWLIGQHGAKKRAQILAGEQEERKKKTNLYRAENKAQSIEDKSDRNKTKFLDDIQKAKTTKDKARVLKNNFPDLTDKQIQEAIENPDNANAWGPLKLLEDDERTGAEIADEYKDRFDSNRDEKIRRIYKASGIDMPDYNTPSEESSPKEMSFPMDIFKDGKKGKVKDAKELEEARSEGWETR